MLLDGLAKKVKVYLATLWISYESEMMIYCADQLFIYFVKLTRLLTKSPEIPSPILNKKDSYLIVLWGLGIFKRAKKIF